MHGLHTCLHTARSLWMDALMLRLARGKVVGQLARFAPKTRGLPSQPARMHAHCCPKVPRTMRAAGCRPAAAAAAAAAPGIGELLAAKQLGDDQQLVLDSVKEYYGEVSGVLATQSRGCWGR